MMILEAKGISKAYHSSMVAVEALKNCSLSFQEGEFAAIIGKSGSGKSTLLRILGTVDTPDTGDVLLEGKSIIGLKDEKLAQIRRRKIGFVYQDYSLFPEFTAYENIVLPIHLDGRKEKREEIEEIMNTLGILSLKDKFPNEMSGGEQQRTAIARALAIHPAVILADEPTGNLDAENGKEVIGLLKRSSRVYDRTIIMVTHDRMAAEYADRVIEIRDGVVQA